MAADGPIRVIILPSWYPAYENDYAGIFFREQAAALAESGLDVTVVSPLRWSLKTLVRRTRPLAPIDGLVEVRRPYLGPPRSPGLDTVIWSAFVRRMYARYVHERGIPDILHVHSLYPAGIVGCALVARKRVLTEHSTGFLAMSATRLQDRDIAALRSFDRRIAVSQHLAHRMESLAPSVGQWNYVPNVVDTGFFVPGSSCDDRIRVLTASNLIPAKRVDMLIRAFDAAFPTGSAELRIAGDGSEHAALKTLAASLRSADRIHFLGAVSRERLKSELDVCTMFALASLYETFGVVLVEALSMGKPVVATDSGGPASIVHAGNGILVPLHDQAALTRALAQLADTSQAYDAESIRADCIGRFGRVAVTAQLKRLYREALDDGR
ncbi:MAG: glycosyltransferase [Burkholderiaceae bacterium]|nr:glycosyltransferase [Burkholderiaceae bacterium]